MLIPKGPKDARFWDEWWKDRQSSGALEEDMFPRWHEVPLGRRPDDLSYHWRDNDDVLATVMIEYGLQTILCAGNGISQEPRALAAAGFDVTTLDISPVAMSRAEERQDDRGLDFCSPEMRRPGGRVQFVVGDLLDTTVCPGPFDAIVERRTVQWFFEQQLADALSALSGRLSKTGILLSQCLAAPFPPDRSQNEFGWFHASESWFRTHGWTIWDGFQSSPLVGRVAWLVRSAP